MVDIENGRNNNHSFDRFFTERSVNGGRIVLITGGSSGIGKELVRVFAQAGDNVYLTYNSGKDRAERLVRELDEYRITALEYDQSDDDSRAKLVERIPKQVEVLIHNAAYGSKTIEAASDSRAEQDQLMMRVNAVGPLLLTEELLPGMKENGYGKIVFISSVGGGITHFPGFRHSDAMSKAAIAYYAQHLGAELVHEQIDVFAVCPGATDTPMLRASTLDDLDANGYESLMNRLPDRRLIDPREIAELCYLLCSTEAARLLRGSVIDASLGLGGNPGLITH